VMQFGEPQQSCTAQQKAAVSICEKRN